MARTNLSTTSDKPFSISQIKSYILITLDKAKLNYDTWRELFEMHSSSFGVLVKDFRDQMDSCY
ncbi:hypothetical protein AXX17_AT1G39880 [Arabidopsis thaliana]|uniref:Uncharacterized protein n=1 Tax=Arabidopsis thaliana TaxID=3702 RepID=A0A178WAR6_ARATH|nr:hypothetical protein AXX17_AT1G39880 [Arabidopsis thaliana]